MKAGWKLFAGLAAFYFLMDVIYWQVGGEALGITAIFLSGGLAALALSLALVSVTHSYWAFAAIAVLVAACSSADKPESGPSSPCSGTSPTCIALA